jgi:hypothetical protein
VIGVMRDMVAAEVKTPFTENLETVLDDAQTQAILEVFDKIEISQWLAQNPFKKLALVERSYVFNTEVRGWYDYVTREAEISATRDTGEWGQRLEWGKVQKLSQTGRTILEAVQFTGIHELGHHIHAELNQKNPLQFKLSLKMPQTNGISEYAKTPRRSEEYFAETFAAWVLYRVELSVNDELGYGMIERALKALGIEVKEYEFNP